MQDTQISEWRLTYALDASADHVHALGAITMQYNLLEYSIVFLLDEYLKTPFSISEAVFDRLTNRQRIDLIRQTVETLEMDAVALSQVQHTLKCFEICCENRNTLMHAIHYNTNHLMQTLTFRKKSSSKSHDLFFTFTLEELRQVAEDMYHSLNHLIAVVKVLEARNPTDRATISDDQTWPEKPAKPRKLNPHQPPQVL